MTQTGESPPTVLITGASGGIGWELAKLFARDSYRLVLVARNRSKLEELAQNLQREFGASAIVLAEDLADLNAPGRIYDTLQRQGIEVDALVNNAGFGDFGPFAETDLKVDLEMMQVNMAALVHLTRLFLPGMVDRKKGRILNVSSMAAFGPGPFMAMYYATKAFVSSFSEAIADELRGTGVTVTALCPGPTRTGFQARAGTERDRLASEFMEAGVVARIGYRGLLAGKAVVIPGLRNRLIALLVKLIPRRLATRLVRMIHTR